MGSNTEKKPRTNLQNSYKIEAKRLRATTFAIAIAKYLGNEKNIESLSLIRIVNLWRHWCEKLMFQY